MKSLYLLVTFLLCASVFGAPAEEALNKPKEPVAKVELSGDQLYDSITRDVSTKVMEKLFQRDLTILTVAGIGFSALIAIAAFLGVRSFKDMRDRIKEQVSEELRRDDRIPEAVRRVVAEQLTLEVETRIASLSDEIALGSLINLANKFDNGTQFSNNERDLAISSLQQLRDKTEIVAKPEFVDAAEKIVDTFAGAGIGGYIDRLENQFSDLFSGVEGIALTLLQHYGLRHIGLPYEDQDCTERFHRYLKACESFDRKGVVFVYRMGSLARFKPVGYEQDLQSICEDIRNLNPPHGPIAIHLLMKLSSPTGISNNPNEMVTRVTGVYAALESQFGPWSEEGDEELDLASILQAMKAGEQVGGGQPDTH